MRLSPYCALPLSTIRSLRYFRLCSALGIAVARQDHVQRVAATEGLEVANGVAEDGKQQLLVWRSPLRVDVQNGPDHVGLRPLSPFVVTREFHAELLRCSRIEAEGNPAACLAVRHFDAAPAIAAGHQVVAELAACITATIPELGNVRAPAPGELRCGELGRCRVSPGHDVAESGH